MFSRNDFATLRVCHEPLVNSDMPTQRPLKPAELYKACEGRDFNFRSTRSVDPLEGILGQDRAEDAVEFAVSMPSSGYNIYAIGRNGLGKRTMVQRYLETRQTSSEHEVYDWCYVNNFDDLRAPRVLRLPAGLGSAFKKDMEQLLVRLGKAIPQAFDNESYFERSEYLKSELAQRQQKALKGLAKQAEKQQVQLTISTPGGYRLVALNGEEPYSPETFSALPEEVQNAFEDKINKLEKKLRNVLRKLAMWEQEYSDSQQKLNEEVTLAVSEHQFDTLKSRYKGHAELIDFLDRAHRDVLENVEVFLEDTEEQSALAAATMDNKLPRRYQVNVLVHHKDANRRPVVIEENPNHYNLFGAVENVTYKGTVFTDFTLIRPGSLHRANGGYLLMDAIKVLEQPFVWDGLKRALRGGGLSPNTLEREMTLSGTISLEPEHVPLDLKIVLFGDRDTYLLLQQYDPDFGELFKVVADFENEIVRTPETQMRYARFISSLVRSKKLLHCDKQAVMRVLEHSARVAEHQERLSLHAADIANLLRESHYWANQEKARLICKEHVEKALESAEFRSRRIRDQVFDNIREGATLIDTQGKAVGQINALSVLSTGDHEFGLPSRLTATCYAGDGNVVDIERNVQLAGAIHSKGMMILTAYLSSQFGRTRPLGVSASITFEQSYSMVDGDSASMAEYCALISAIAEVPLRQDLAITGSMNQFGVAQSVGGVNEKIEGFYDTCCIQGLTGSQGVILPRSNVRNLMLNQRVLKACQLGEFSIYAVDSVEQALALLTGMTIGKRLANNHYSKGSLLELVQQRLEQMSSAASGKSGSKKASRRAARN